MDGMREAKSRPNVAVRTLDGVVNSVRVGCGVWSRTGTKRDPRTGRRRRYLMPESAHHVTLDENLRIVPQGLWDAVRAQEAKIAGVWPRRGGRGFNSAQGSRVCDNRLTVCRPQPFGRSRVRASVQEVDCRAVGALQELLERRIPESARVLRRLLGEVVLEPVKPENGRAYYVARTAIDTFVLVEPPGPRGGLDGGSGSLRWWRRRPPY